VNNPDPEVSDRQRRYAERWDRKAEVKHFWLWFYFGHDYAGRQG